MQYKLCFNVPMEIEIDIKSPYPVYRQLIDQIKAGVLAGALSGGDTLPPIRLLAIDLGLNPNTVAKAYKQLESQQIIQTARRAGTFIREDANLNCVAANKQSAKVEMEQIVETFKQRGMGKQEITQLLKAQIRQLS